VDVVQEPLTEGWLGAPFGGEDLERGGGAEPHVPGAVDDADRPAADHRLDAVAAQLGAEREATRHRPSWSPGTVRDVGVTLADELVQRGVARVVLSSPSAERAPDAGAQLAQSPRDVVRRQRVLDARHRGAARVADERVEPDQPAPGADHPRARRAPPQAALVGD